MATIKGITIEIGGDTQKLTKALEDVNQKTRNIQTELKQVERLLKLDPKNTELLAQKQKLLAEAVDNSREKLERLKTAQEQVNAQFAKGDMSEEQYRAFQREVVKAEQELKSFEGQLRQTGLTAEQVGQKFKDAGSKMTNIGKDLSLKVTAPIVAVGAASFKMAADLQDAMGATDQIFKSASDSVKSWADNLEGYYGIAEGEALEYANKMGALLQNIGGLTEEEAAKQSQVLVQLAGDLAAMFGGTTESAVQALTGALKGNTSMLDNYGIAANEALIKSKALEMGLISEGEQLDLAAKQAATLALIMEQTGAAQGQAARESEGASGTMRTLTTEVKNLATNFGEVLIPAITPIIQKIGEFITWLGSLDEGTLKTIAVIAGLAAAIGPLLMILGNLSKALGSIIAIAPKVGAAFTLMTGPVGIIIAAIAALIAIGVAVWQNWDTISEKATEIWGNISNFFEGVWSNITGFFSGAWDKIQSIWSGIGDFFGQIPDKIGQAFSTIKDIILSPFRAAWKGIESGINWLIDMLNQISFDIPDWVPFVGGQHFGINIPNISLPSFKGWNGRIPGLEGEAQLAVVHGGEYIYQTPKGNPENVNNINFNISGMVVREEADINRIARELYSLMRMEQRSMGLV